MKLKKRELREILDRLVALSDDYWISTFKKIEGLRQESVDDLLAELTHLFDLTRQKVDTALTLYLTRYGDDLSNWSLPMNSSEISELKSDISDIEKDLKSRGLDFDKDIKDKIDRLGTRTSRMDALKLWIDVLVFHLYAVAGMHIYRHMQNAVDEAHARTVFAMFKAAGYGSRNIHKLTEEEIADILEMVWRSTEEKFDDAVWRYGRSQIIDLEMLFGRGLFAGRSSDEIRAEMEKRFKPGLRDLANLLRTDTTFMSTKGQQKAFVDLLIEEAVFTAIIDDRTTDWCLEADGNVVAVEDITPWVNAPPLHYNCRSTMVPIVKAVDWLTGDVYTVDGDFDDWYHTWD